MAATFASLISAGLVFTGSHVLISSTRWRGDLRDSLGERGYLALYSLVAMVSFAWFILAYARAPYLALWPSALWTRWLAIIVMPLATILVLCGLSAANPTGVGMERLAAADDPAPGILRVTRHPVMWGFGLWGIVHLLANGDLASLIFFGALAGLALGGTVLIDRKKRLALGSNWARLTQITSNIPFAALLAGRTRFRLYEIGLLRLVAGLLLYAVLLLAHPLFTGGHVVMP